MLSKYKQQVNNISFFDICQEKHPSGRVLLILHGWKQNKESWIPVIERLAKHCRVICPDLPGFGESINATDYTLSPIEYSHQVKDLLDALDIEKTSILAHSFGGRIAVLFAVSCPERVDKLILYSPAGIREKKAMILEQLARRIPKKLKLPFFSALIQTDDRKEADALSVVFHKAITFDVIPFLHHIHVPTLVIWGDEDDVLPVKMQKLFLQEIPSSIGKQIKGYGHFLHMQNPLLFVSSILPFLIAHETI